jgi:hypothetical protein
MATKTVNFDIAQRLDITVRRGDTLSIPFTFFQSDGTTPKNVSTYNFYMQVRESGGDDGTFTSVLSTDMSNNSVDFINTSTANPSNTAGGVVGEITIDSTNAANGIILVKANRAAMANVFSGTYFYDLQAETVDANQTPDTVATWLAGKFIVNEDVTLPST